MSLCERKRKGNEGEIAVANVLTKHGRTVLHMRDGDPFDLLVDGVWRVEVKTASCTTEKGLPTWQFKLSRAGKLIEDYDLYIFRLEGMPFGKFPLHVMLAAPFGRKTFKLTFRSLLGRYATLAGDFLIFANGMGVRGFRSGCSEPYASTGNNLGAPVPGVA
jgi:hypothetical protein